MTKTPSYTRKAIQNYEKKVKRYSVLINPDIDAKLIDKIEQDVKPFGTLVKELLKKHYDL